MNKTVVITGSAAGIGRALKEAYDAQGFTVFGIDLEAGETFQGDVGKKENKLTGSMSLSITARPLP